MIEQSTEILIDNNDKVETPQEEWNMKKEEELFYYFHFLMFSW